MEQISVKRHNIIYYCHTIVVFLFVLGFGLLPPVAGLTPIGMNILGIFIGVIYGWSTVDMIWPSLLGLIALCFSGIAPTGQVISMAFGSDIFSMMLIMFTIMQLIQANRCSDWIANKILSISLFRRSPWLLMFGILLADYFVAMIAGGPFISAIIFWSVSYGLFRQYNMKPGDKFPTLMIMGIMIIACTALVAFPFKGNSITLIATYNSMGVGEIDFAKYMLFTIPMALLLIVTYILICRFVFRLDLSKIAFDKNDTSFIVKTGILTAKQKWSLALIVAVVLINCIPSVFPATWALTKLVKGMGMTGRFAVLMIALMIIHVDGKPLLDVREMAAKGIMWEAMYLAAFIVPISAYMTADETGIKGFIVQLLTPLLGNHSPIVFTILLVLVAIILTNLANNGVVCIILMSACVPFAAQMGINPAPICVLLMLTTQLAIATPAASPFAGILFGNTEWMRKKDIYFYGSISTLLCAVVMATVGYAYVSFIWSAF